MPSDIDKKLKYYYEMLYKGYLSQYTHGYRVLRK